MKDGKFLMAGNDKDDFLYSVGGRVKFGETSAAFGSNYRFGFFDPSMR